MSHVHSKNMGILVFFYFFHQVAVSDENQENVYRPVEASGLPEVSFFLRVRSNEKSWTVRRTFSDLCSFDKQLHRCIYDRNYSLLRELHSQADISESDIPVSMAECFHKPFTPIRVESRFSSITCQ